MTEPRSAAEAVSSATERFEQAGSSSPRLDAELLVGHVLGVDRAGLVIHGSDPLGAPQAARIEELVARRCEREPVAQIIGSRWFRNIQLHVDSNVLSPRPETELLVEWGVRLPQGSRVADVGTGSGAIALALADERPDLDIVATDIDAAALQVAIGNAARLGADVAFVQGDLLEAVDGHLDAVVSNPPYIPEADVGSLEPEVSEFEPRIALTPGPDGLEAVRGLLAQAAGRGVPLIAIEVGAGQAGETAAAMSSLGWLEIEIFRDLAGVERVVTGAGRSVDQT